MTYAGRIWLGEWKRKSWKNTRSKKANERPSEVEVPSLGMEEGAQKNIYMYIYIWNKCCERSLGKKFSCFQNTTCSVCQCKQEGSTKEEEMKQQ